MQEDIEFKKIKSELLGKVPDRLLYLASSENTPLRVAEICLENGVSKEEDVEKVGYGVGLVLLGQLPPAGLLIFLERGLGINADAAQNIYEKLSAIIFFDVKDDLSKFYGMEPAEGKKEEVKKPALEQQKPQTKDTYREQI